MNTILLTPKQTAKMLNLTTATLYEWRKVKKHLRYVQAGGRVFYYKNDVEDFIKNHTFLPED